jgi:3-oxoacyl-[acyl-carrier-protein] synthase-3
MNILITGLGAAVPGPPIPNSAFYGLDIDDEWIASRTGVHHRHHLGPGESLAELAAEAGRAAFRDAAISGKGVDFVIAATSTPDQPSPGIAPRIANLVGSPGAGAVDLNGACTGFLYALDYAIAKIDHGGADRILVVGADAMSRITDADDKNTAVLFGDGAGAVVVEASGGRSCDQCAPMLSFGSAGERMSALYVSPDSHKVVMDGAEVYLAAVEAMSGELDHVLASSALEATDIAQLVCHQANGRIIAAVARRLRWPKERVLSYVDRFGNTSAASIPIALATGRNEQRFVDGDRLALAAFGAGFSWGAGLVTWKECTHQQRPAIREEKD